MADMKIDAEDLEGLRTFVTGIVFSFNELETKSNLDASVTHLYTTIDGMQFDVDELNRRLKKVAEKLEKQIPDNFGVH